MIPPGFTVPDDELMPISSQNSELRFERADRTPPMGRIFGSWEATVVAYRLNWGERYGLGEVFNPSNRFKLASGAMQFSYLNKSMTEGLSIRCLHNSVKAR